MSLAKYNKTDLTHINPVDTKNHTWEKLENLYKTNGKYKKYPVLSLYISKKSKYGEQAIVVTDNNFVALPSHMTHTVIEMLNDPEVIADINERKAGFTIYEYESHNRNCYSINWVEF